MINSKILLVEDDEVVQKIHGQMLRELGYEVDIAATGKTALTLSLSKNPYRLVFMDIGLPDMSGLDVIAAIRATERASNRTPIVVLTAYSDELLKSACFSAGADLVLNKPIKFEVLQKLTGNFIAYKDVANF